MIYELTENMEKIGDLYFEMDTDNNIHVYTLKDFKRMDSINMGYKLDYDDFIEYCNNYIKNLDK